MMSVWDTLESSSPEDYKKKSKITRIMVVFNVSLHGALVIVAAALFIFFLPSYIDSKTKC